MQLWHHRLYRVCEFHWCRMSTSCLSDFTFGGGICVLWTHSLLCLVHFMIFEKIVCTSLCLIATYTPASQKPHYLFKKLRRECVHKTQMPPPKAKSDEHEVDVRHQWNSHTQYNLWCQSCIPISNQSRLRLLRNVWRKLFWDISTIYKVR